VPSSISTWMRVVPADAEPVAASSLASARTTASRLTDSGDRGQGA
jgi:hypothetical protein